MKKLFFYLVLILLTSSVFSQDNLTVVKYKFLEAVPEKKDKLKTIKVPEGEVWRIESALCEVENEYVSLVIGDNAYILTERDAGKNDNPSLPFYLPGGTEFKLGSRGDKGIISICVLRIE